MACRPSKSSVTGLAAWPKRWICRPVLIAGIASRSRSSSRLGRIGILRSSRRNQAKFHRGRNCAEFAMAELPVHRLDVWIVSAQELHDRAPVLTIRTDKWTRFRTSPRTGSAPDFGASKRISFSCDQSVCLIDAARVAARHPHSRLTSSSSDSWCKASRLASGCSWASSRKTWRQSSARL